jgi:prephenate dehydrogenase
MKRVGIVGLGLIGGSIALGVRRHFPECRIVGADRDVGPWPDALLDEFVSVNGPEDLSAGMPECDLLVLAVPVVAVLALLGPALDTGSVVTDVASTKRRVLASAATHPQARRFVPGHPMAGAPHNGFAHARADLFADAGWLLCPAGAEPSAVSLVRTVATTLGAVVHEMSAEGHDRAVALTSHLPQLLANVLFAAAREHGYDAAVGPAFERITRGAGGGRSMWPDVFETNADFVAEQAERLGAQLMGLARDLRADPPDLDSLRQLLDAARQAKDAPG